MKTFRNLPVVVQAIIAIGLVLLALASFRYLLGLFVLVALGVGVWTIAKWLLTRS